MQNQNRPVNVGETRTDSEPDTGSPGGTSAPSTPWRSKYTRKAALRYQIHTDRKDRAESRLIERAFELVPLGSVLDIPCGGGRMSLLLARKGYEVTAADLSDPMLEIARQNARAANLAVNVVRQDLEKMEFPDLAFDTVLSFRLFHHFPNREIRARAVGQLCRVARTRVVMSYFSPWAGTSVKRAIQGKWLGYKQKKFATSLGEIEGYFRPHNFRLVRNFARAPLLHTLHLAIFERVTPASR